MSYRRMLTSREPVWFAEVRQLTSTTGPEFDAHHRPTSEGGPYFNTKRTARRWCETTMVELLAAGVAPQDLEAIAERGRFIWPQGRPERREFIDDTPAVSYVGRSDAHRTGFEWIYDGDPEVKPNGH